MDNTEGMAAVRAVFAAIAAAAAVWSREVAHIPPGSYVRLTPDGAALAFHALDAWTAGDEPVIMPVAALGDMAAAVAAARAATEAAAARDAARRATEEVAEYLRLREKYGTCPEGR